MVDELKGTFEEITRQAVIEADKATVEEILEMREWCGLFDDLSYEYRYGALQKYLQGLKADYGIIISEETQSKIEKAYRQYRKEFCKL